MTSIFVNQIEQGLCCSSLKFFTAKRKTKKTLIKCMVFFSDYFHHKVCVEKESSFGQNIKLILNMQKFQH